MAAANTEILASTTQQAEGTQAQAAAVAETVSTVTEVAPGVPGHRVLVTSLVNRALPLIRYELADAVTLAPGPDPAGRPYQRIMRVDGRNDDILRFPAVGDGDALVLLVIANQMLQRRNHAKVFDPCAVTRRGKT